MERGVQGGAGVAGDLVDGPRRVLAVLIDGGQQVGQPRGQVLGPLVVGLMIAYTILLGVRRMDPTDRHPGMVATITAEADDADDLEDCSDFE